MKNLTLIICPLLLFLLLHRLVIKLMKAPPETVAIKNIV